MGHLQRNVFPSILPILLSLVSLFGYSVFKVLDNHYVTAKVELIVYTFVIFFAIQAMLTFGKSTPCLGQTPVSNYRSDE